MCKCVKRDAPPAPTSDAGHGGAGWGEGVEGRVGRRAQLLLRVALHHGAVLSVAILAAALASPALLRAHRVTAAVVAEGPPAQPGKQEVTRYSFLSHCRIYWNQPLLCKCMTSTTRLN